MFSKRNAKKKGKPRPVNSVREKYEFLATELGSGAYATVFLGTILETGESVAIKKIDKSGLRHRDMAKLHMEANILKKLDHCNVVKVHDSFEDEHFFYIVMEYIGGGELFKHIVDDERQFTEDEAREILRTMLMALQYCKNNGVVHRDIKPENVLLTKDGEVKIVDFNLAKQIDKDIVEFNVLETMCGTPNYVAPEVISGTPYDYKCDIWSVGVIAYLVLSGGYLPFFVNKKKEGSNARDALLKKVMLGKWKFAPASAWMDVSPDAKDFIESMLVRNPEARYGYEQLLAHKWMKVGKQDINTRALTARKLDIGIIKKVLTVAAVTDAAKTFEGLMGEKEEEDLPGKADGNIMNSQDALFDSLALDPMGGI